MLYIYYVYISVKSTFVRPQNQHFRYVMHSVTFHKTYTYISFLNEFGPSTAVQQRQHVDAVRCRTFFSGVISMSVFHILQIPTRRIQFCRACIAPTCTHPGYGALLQPTLSHNCIYSSKITFSAQRSCRTPLAPFCRTRTLKGTWTTDARGSDIRSDYSRMCTDFFTGLIFPIMTRLGESVSELPAPCRTTRAQGSSGSRCLGWLFLTVHTYGDTGTREPSPA